MRRLEGPLGGRGGGKGKPCRQFAQMRVGSRRRKGRGMQTDAWDGARKGCGRARPQAGTRGRTWAATRRRGHRETAATMTALKRCSFTPFFIVSAKILFWQKIMHGTVCMRQFEILCKNLEIVGPSIHRVLPRIIKGYGFYHAHVYNLIVKMTKRRILLLNKLCKGVLC